MGTKLAQRRHFTGRENGIFSALHIAEMHLRSGGFPGWQGSSHELQEAASVEGAQARLLMLLPLESRMHVAPSAYQARNAHLSFGQLLPQNLPDFGGVCYGPLLQPFRSQARARGREMRLRGLKGITLGPNRPGACLLVI
jgi:hypothetical protein